MLFLALGCVTAYFSFAFAASCVAGSMAQPVNDGADVTYAAEGWLLSRTTLRLCQR